MFERILIANRGESAARLARTLRRLGADTVAVCVEAEQDALHVQACDTHAVLRSSAADPHRDVRAIVAAARESGAVAVHPGYGLFDESPELVRALERAGLQVIGPSAEWIALLRDRALLRQAAREAGLRVLDALPAPPLVEEPTEEAIAAWRAATLEEVLRVGLPLVVKPAFGIAEPTSLQVLEDEDEARAWASAREPSEPDVILERYIDRPRHVEVYVASDGDDFVALGDVEVSVRKEHRRVIAESPAPAIDALHRGDAIRSALWAASIDLARELGLRGVGRVHFLFDARGSFHFVGMGAGLAPEHALIELAANLDLAEVEVAVALGEPLPRQASAAEPSGHAVQARVEAALDPRNARPFPGRVEDVRWPPAPAGKVRIEASVQPGSLVAPHHDPLVATVSTYAPTRHEAVLALDRVVAETRIAPLTTNLRLLRRALNLESFRASAIDETLLDRI